MSEIEPQGQEEWEDEVDRMPLFAKLVLHETYRELVTDPRVTRQATSGTGESAEFLKEEDLNTWLKSLRPRTLSPGENIQIREMVLKSLDEISGSPPGTARELYYKSHPEDPGRMIQ